MAITSGFFNSINGDRKYNAKQIGAYLGKAFSSGVFPNPPTNLQVVAAGGMNIKVHPGRAMIDGYWLDNDGMQTIALEAAGMALARIDAVVVRLNENDEARFVELTVKKGPSETSPKGPEMERSAYIQEYCLALVYVAPMRADGTQEIAQDNITDTRSDTSLCGYVTINAAASRGGDADTVDGKHASELQNYDNLTNKPTSIQAETQLSTDWTGEAAPYSQAITVSGVTGSSIVDIDVASSVTLDQLDAFLNAKIVDGGQSTDTITLKAFGEKPEVVIPIKIVVRKV